MRHHKPAPIVVPTDLCPVAFAFVGQQYVFKHDTQVMCTSRVNYANADCVCFDRN